MSSTNGRLREAVADALGLPDAELVARTGGGASRSGFTVRDSSGVGRAFLLVESDQRGLAGTKYDLRRETAMLDALAPAGLPVPRVLARLVDHHAALFELMPGSNVIPPESVASTSAEYARLIAMVHATSPAVVDDAPAATVSDAVEHDLQWWTELARDLPGGDDATLEALALLGRRMPRSAAPPCLVHGDAGPGNFLVEDGRVSALLDWEMAHAGDHHEDLAWMWIRAVHSDFGSMPDVLAAYEAAGSRRIDTATLTWHVAFVLAKTVVALSVAMSRQSTGSMQTTQYQLWLAYRALLHASSSKLEGTPYPLLERVPVTSSTPRSKLLDRLTDLVVGDDREAKRILRLLKAAAEQDDWARAEERRIVTSSVRPSSWSVRADLELYASPGASTLVRRALAIGLG